MGGVGSDLNDHQAPSPHLRLYFLPSIFSMHCLIAFATKGEKAKPTFWNIFQIQKQTYDSDGKMTESLTSSTTYICTLCSFHLHKLLSISFNCIYCLWDCSWAESVCLMLTKTGRRCSVAGLLGSPGLETARNSERLLAFHEKREKKVKDVGNFNGQFISVLLWWVMKK